MVAKKGMGALINALLNPSCYSHKVKQVSVIETHISWVILTGKLAYKIKKPVDLGFCDFTTLEKRKKFCEEELRLNSRLAPKIYIDVVPISGTVDSPRMEGDDEPFEYAVKMFEFDQNTLAARAVTEGKVTGEMVDRLAKNIAEFHDNAPVADSSMPYGEPARLFEPMKNSFTIIFSHIDDPDMKQRIACLQSFSEEEYRRHKGFLEGRKAARFIRECHGDMHLGNMCIIENDFMIYDAIEFNDYLRWIDVMSEIAFLVIDFIDRERPDLGWRLLDRYLAHTGDYESLQPLRHFMIYRALVRAKVNIIRVKQPNIGREEETTAEELFHEYVALAESLAKPPSRPTIYITKGAAGSGKSSVAGRIVEKIGAIRMRSDIERKRLFRHSAGDAGHTIEEMYSDDATDKVYNRLLELAETVIGAGYDVVVDATFLKQAQRAPFFGLAKSLGANFLILDISVDLDLARSRIQQRAKDGNDPSEAGIEVMKKQIEVMEPLTEGEKKVAVLIDAGSQKSVDSVNITILKKKPYEA